MNNGQSNFHLWKMV